MMKTSVVIPTYNASRFLRETLDSVFAQKPLPHEVIVVDDASTDDTPAILRELAANAPVPLQVIELTPNTGGPAAPLNVGIDAARGEYIALLDHDDLMLVGKLAVQSAVLDQCPDIELVLSDYDLLCGGQVEYQRAPWPWGASAGESQEPAADLCAAPDLAPKVIKSALGPCRLCIVDSATSTRSFIRAPGLPCSCSNMFFRKNLWLRLGGFDRRAGQCSDYDFIMRAAGRRLAWVDAKLFRKRVHDNNLWQDTPCNQLKTFRAQRRCLDVCDAAGDLRLGVAIRGTALARRMRSQRQYAASFRAALELFLLGHPRRAAAEACMTLLLLPAHVAADAARAGARVLRRRRPVL